MNPYALTPAVKQLLIAIVICFIATFLLSDINLLEKFSLRYFMHPDFRPWQLITNMFFHGNLMHILFNALALVIIGTQLENIIGTKKFIQLYFISGLGAVIVFYGLNMILCKYYIDHFIITEQLLNEQYMLYGESSGLNRVIGIYSAALLGASGCIMGLLGCFLFYFPNQQMYLFLIPFPIKAKYLITGFIIFDLYAGFDGGIETNIAHFGHVGGAIFGFLVAWYWRKHDNKNFY